MTTTDTTTTVVDTLMVAPAAAAAAAAASIVVSVMMMMMTLSIIKKSLGMKRLAMTLTTRILTMKHLNRKKTWMCPRTK